MNFFLSQLYNLVCKFCNETEISLKVTKPNQLLTTKYPVKTTSELPTKLSPSSFHYLVFFTTLDLRLVVADHIIIKQCGFFEGALSMFNVNLESQNNYIDYWKLNKSFCIYRYRNKVIIIIIIIIIIRVGPYKEKLWPLAWKCSIFKTSVTVFPYTDLPAGQ